MPVNATGEADEILNRFLDSIGATGALARDPLYAAQAASFRDWFRVLSVVLHDEGLGSAKRSLVLRRMCYAMRGPAEAEERLRSFEEADGRIGALRRRLIEAMTGHPWRPVLPDDVVEAPVICDLAGCPNGPDEHTWAEGCIK